MTERRIGLKAARLTLIGFSAILAALALLDISGHYLNAATLHSGLSVLCFGYSLNPERFLKKVTFKENLIAKEQELLNWRHGFSMLGGILIVLAVVTKYLT